MGGVIGAERNSRTPAKVKETATKMEPMEKKRQEEEREEEEQESEEVPMLQILMKQRNLGC